MFFYFSGHMEFHNAPEVILGKANVMTSYYDIDERKVDPETGVPSITKALQNYAEKLERKKKRKKK